MLDEAHAAVDHEDKGEFDGIIALAMGGGKAGPALLVDEGEKLLLKIDIPLLAHQYLKMAAVFHYVLANLLQ